MLHVVERRSYNIQSHTESSDCQLENIVIHRDRQKSYCFTSAAFIRFYLDAKYSSYAIFARLLTHK